MKKLLFLCITTIIFGITNVATAVPIAFDVAGESNGSSVSLDNITKCLCTSISVELATGLDDEIFTLNNGESYKFDFFDITVSGFGCGTADVSATLAFDSPYGYEVTGSGTGGWFTVFGIFSGGLLTWNDMPQTITLSNGNWFDVDFENVCELGFGNSTTVAATVTAHTSPVPEPSTILLIGCGLIGLMTYNRQRCLRKKMS